MRSGAIAPSVGIRSNQIRAVGSSIGRADTEGVPVLDAVSIAPVPPPADATPSAVWISKVFEDVGSSVRARVLAATRDAEVASEVTQEAFLRLLREAQGDRRPALPGAWLHRTAMNLAISRIRRASVAQRLAPRLVEPDAAPMTEGIVLDRERWRAVDEALSELSPTERGALVMAARGMSGEDIAVRLGKSHGATRSLMFRARGRLRRQLASQDLT